MSPWHLRHIARQIENGALIAYPTDTIWGFGCHPLSFASVRRLQNLKRRPQHKGLLLLSSSLDFCVPYIDDADIQQLSDAVSQPQTRPVTWIVKCSPDCPDWLTGKTDTIAIRITHNPLIKQLCETLRSPLVSTSANISGRPTARNSLLVHKHFRYQVDFIVEGFKTGSCQSSEIRNLKTSEILRG